jgi:outer membrane protein OmpA-like peptidoglycan-associated protein
VTTSRSGGTTSGSPARSTSGYYWEQRRRGVGVPVLVGALGLAALGIAQYLPIRDHVESDLTARSRKALEAAQLSGIDVSFSGRDGRLSGTVGSRADADRATALVRSLDGVRVVDVRLSYPGSSLQQPSGTPSPTQTSAAASPTETSAAASPTGAPSGTQTATGTSAPATPSPTPTPTPTSVSTPDAVQSQLGALPAITFETGSATLTRQGQSAVVRAARIIAASPDARVDIRGYTDDLGDWDVNLELSKARANTVRITLILNGVPPSRLTSRGFSEQNPLVPNDSAAHRAQNRRVEYVVLH